MTRGLNPSAALYFLVVGLALSTSAAQDTNAGVLRESAGLIEYRATDSDVPRGSERWTLMVHHDGSRTLHAQMHNRQRGSRTHITQRVDSAFRPLDAIVQRWTGNDYLGIGLFMVDDNVLTGQVLRPAESASHQLAMGPDVTLLSHAVAADVWLEIPADLEAHRKREVKAYSIALNATTPPFLGKIITTTVEWVAKERIEVPAGRFDTTHLRLAGRFDVWIFGPDRTMARMLDEQTGREYVLVEYTRAH